MLNKGKLELYIVVIKYQKAFDHIITVCNECRHMLLLKRNSIELILCHRNYFKIQVDDNGAHIPGAGLWGHCSKDCPGASEAPTTQEVKEEQEKVLEELKVPKSLVNVISRLM